MKDLDKQLRDIIDRARKQFAIEVVRVLKRRLADDVVAIFDGLYTREFGDLSSKMSSQNDPTHPMNLRPYVMNYLRSEADRFISTLSEGNIESIRISFFDIEGFGTSEPEPEETDPLSLFFFYVEGVPGEFAFVNKDIYKVFNPKSSREDIRLGRFGEGFLIERSVYEKRREKLKKAGLKVPPSFDAIKSPLSGLPPSRIFLDLNELVKNHIEKNYIEEAKNKAFR